jgi:magnesium-transporting ATPase (P-type)
MKYDGRETQIYKKGKWTKINFSELKDGDVFRLFESDGAIVADDHGCEIFKAKGDTYIDKKSGVLAICIAAALLESEVEK